MKILVFVFEKLKFEVHWNYSNYTSSRGKQWLHAVERKTFNWISSHYIVKRTRCPSNSGPLMTFSSLKFQFDSDPVLHWLECHFRVMQMYYQNLLCEDIWRFALTSLLQCKADLAVYFQTNPTQVNSFACFLPSTYDAIGDWKGYTTFQWADYEGETVTA